MTKKKKPMTQAQVQALLRNPFSGRTQFHRPTKSHRKNKKPKDKMADWDLYN